MAARSDALTPGAARLHFRVLGPLEVDFDGVPLPLGGAKQQLVLALLLLQAGRVVSVERLVEGVWGHDTNERNPATLQVYVSNLRRIVAPAAAELDRSVIVTRRPGYLVELGTQTQLDLEEFERLRLRGEDELSSGRPLEAATSLRAALRLWRGAPLDGLPFDPAMVPHIDAIESRRLTATDRLAEASLAAGAHREFLPELEELVATHPLHERLRGHLMVALYRCGRQADALEIYADGRRRLVEELGLEPSPPLRDLEARILRQDPALATTTVIPPPTDDTASTLVRSSQPAVRAYIEHEGAFTELDQPVTTIGRRPDRDLVIDDPEVSRMHAEIRRTGDSYVLVDTGSANGTLVNGERIAESPLSDGHLIRIGGRELLFRLRTPADPILGRG